MLNVAFLSGRHHKNLRSRWARSVVRSFLKRPSFRGVKLEVNKQGMTPRGDGVKRCLAAILAADVWKQNDRQRRGTSRFFPWHVERKS